MNDLSNLNYIPEYIKYFNNELVLSIDKILDRNKKFIPYNEWGDEDIIQDIMSDYLEYKNPNFYKNLMGNRDLFYKYCDILNSLHLIDRDFKSLFVEYSDCSASLKHYVNELMYIDCIDESSFVLKPYMKDLHEFYHSKIVSLVKDDTLIEVSKYGCKKLSTDSNILRKNYYMTCFLRGWDKFFPLIFKSNINLFDTITDSNSIDKIMLLDSYNAIKNILKVFQLYTRIKGIYNFEMQIYE